MNKNFKMMALAASVIALAACSSNRKDDSKKSLSALAASGEQNVTQTSLNSVFKGLEGSYSAADTSLSSKMSQVSLKFNRSNVSTNGGISSTGSLSFNIALAGLVEPVILASLDDVNSLKLNQVVQLSVAQNDDLATGLGGLPTVKAICLERGNGCTKVGILMSILSNGNTNGGITTKTSNAGFIFDSSSATPVISQPGLQSAPSI